MLVGGWEGLAGWIANVMWGGWIVKQLGRVGWLAKRVLMAG